MGASTGDSAGRDEATTSSSFSGSNGGTTVAVDYHSFGSPVSVGCCADGYPEEDSRDGRLLDDLPAGDDKDRRPRLPPPQIVKHLDLVNKSGGWERLVPSGPTVDYPTYVNYLEEFYNQNGRLAYLAAANHKPEEWPLQPAVAQALQGATVTGCVSNDGLAAAAEYMEEQLVAEWRSRRRRRARAAAAVFAGDADVLASTMIQDRARSIIHGAGAAGSDPATSAAAMLCLAKEAQLTRELLRRGAESGDYLVVRSSQIRMCALSLMSYKGCYSIIPAASMLGIAREAKLMCDWMRKEDRLVDVFSVSAPVELQDGRRIRQETFDATMSLLEDYCSSLPAAAVCRPQKEESASESEISSSSPRYKYELSLCGFIHVPSGVSMHFLDDQKKGTDAEKCARKRRKKISTKLIATQPSNGREEEEEELQRENKEETPKEAKDNQVTTKLQRRADVMPSN